MKKKIYVFAMFVGLVCGLQAEQNGLEKQLPELVRLSYRIKDTVLQKQIGEVIAYATDVLKDKKRTPEQVQKAINAVTKASMRLKQSAIVEKAKASSSSDCNVCSELSDLESDLGRCCCTLHHKLEEILQSLDTNCAPSIAIDSVPYVITESGKYCVTEDLIYSGDSVAITVNADNVSINFANHSLSLTNTDAVGIEVQGNEFLLENDKISGPTGGTADNAAIFLNGVNKATLRNIYTQNTTHGVMMTNASDVIIENSLFQNHSGLEDEDVTPLGGGVWMELSTNVSIDSCTFEGITAVTVEGQTANGVFIFESINVSITNSSFSDWLIAINVYSAINLKIENCLAIASQYSDESLVQLGNTFSDVLYVEDVVIRNSTFFQPYDVPGFDGLLLYQGSGCLLENVVVNTISGLFDGYAPAGIHIGCSVNGECDPGVAFDNVYAQDCLVTGQNYSGLYVEEGRNITFNRSQFTQATQANVFFDAAAQNCIISNSVMGNAVGAGYGVYIHAGATENAIIDSEIANNGAGGVIVAGTAADNFIRGNRIFENGIVGIFNSEPSTAFFFNTCCNNPTNCIGVNPLVATTPTDPIVAGGNVCCANPP